MRFVLDENLPPRMARILRELQEGTPHEVVHLAADLNMRGATDEAWLVSLFGGSGFAIVTHDAGIRRHPQELAAWQAQGHIVFFLARGWQSLPFQELAWRLVRWWPAIVAAAERAEPGDAYIVPFQGSPSQIKKISDVYLKGGRRPRHRR